MRTRVDVRLRELPKPVPVVYSWLIVVTSIKYGTRGMLEISAETSYDLKFQLLRIPVRIHPMFWVVAACLGWRGEYLGLTVVWVGCVFVSILVHEFGHGLAARHFGGHPSIVLQTMGGLCSSSGWASAWESIVIILAGPLAGLALFLVVLTGCDLWIGLNLSDAIGIIGFGNGAQLESARDKIFLIQNMYVRTAIINLISINLYWSLINLLPIFPLDGGQLLGVTLSQTRLTNATRLTHVVGLVVSGIIAAYFLQGGGLSFTAIWFGYFAFYNFQILQAMQGQGFDRWN